MPPRISIYSHCGRFYTPLETGAPEVHTDIAHRRQLGQLVEELASLAPEKLYEIVCEDLRVLLGVRGKPTFQHCVFYPKAIPQYNVGYGSYRELMSEIETKVPGIFLAGHYRDGVSLSDSIVSGCNVAERVAKIF